MDDLFDIFDRDRKDKRHSGSKPGGLRGMLGRLLGDSGDRRDDRPYDDRRSDDRDRRYDDDRDRDRDYYRDSERRYAARRDDDDDDRRDRGFYRDDRDRRYDDDRDRYDDGRPKRRKREGFLENLLDD
jgi:hypothetical protein